MTHAHIAGSIHADVAKTGPQWLTLPEDLNQLRAELWPTGTDRDEMGRIVIGGVPLTRVASEQGTPAYVIDEQDFRARSRAFRDNFAGWRVYYAGKALLTRAVARWVAEEGLHLDVTTMGEMRIALSGGMPAERLGFHGNNKSAEEIRFALEQGVGRIIVDSFHEIDRIETACRELGSTARALVRVTTGVEAHTHEYIATAHEDQKFGLSILGGHALAALVRCQSSPFIELRGIHSHIGSQIFETHGFEVAIRRTLRLAEQFRVATGVELAELDLGGGFGIAYTEADSPMPTDALARGDPRPRVPGGRVETPPAQHRTRPRHLRSVRGCPVRGRDREGRGAGEWAFTYLRFCRRGHERQHPARPVRRRVLLCPGEPDLGGRACVGAGRREALRGR